MSLNELKKAPFEALAGVSEHDAELIREAFNRKVLSRYVNIASAIVTLAAAEE